MDLKVHYAKHCAKKQEKRVQVNFHGLHTPSITNFHQIYKTLVHKLMRQVQLKVMYPLMATYKGKNENMT